MSLKVTGQNSKYDSLINLLGRIKEDTSKVNILQQLFEETKRNKIDTAYLYARMGLAISSKIEYKKGIAEASLSMGYIYYYKNNYAAALKYYLTAYDLFEQLQDSPGMINSSLTIGKIHRIEKNYPKALEYTQNAISLAEKAENKDEMMAAYVGLGNILGVQNKFDEAIEIFRMALKLAIELDKKEAEPIILNNIAEGYNEKGDIDMAIDYELKALKIMNNTPEYSQDKLLRKSKSGILNTVSDLYYSKGEYSTSLFYAKEALNEINEAGYGKEKKDIYKTLSKISAAQNNYSDAYMYVQLYSKLKDSIFDEESTRQIAEMQTKYQSEKKEKENIELKGKNEMQDLLLQSETEKSKNQLIISFVITGILIIGSFYIYSRRKLKQKAVYANELAKQEKLRFKYVIEAEEKERSRIAQDLHDGLGQMLSTARLNVSGLEDSVIEEDKLYVERSVKIIDDACAEVRNISHNLMPNTLIRLGLISAIQELVNNINASNLMKIDFNFNFTESIDKSFAIPIYRIVQEILNNMIKHSEADHIYININRSEDRLLLSMVDNGIGFNTEILSDSKGIGWKNIFSRVSLLNGVIELDSKNQEGTSVKINLNLKNG